MVGISKCPACRQDVTIPQGVDDAALVRCPLCDAEFPLSEVTPHAAVAPPELVVVAVDSAAPTEAEREEGPAAEVPRLDVWERVTDVPQIDTGSGEETVAGHESVDAAAFDFGGDDSEAGEESTSVTAAERGRRPKTEKSALREWLGIVLGGAAGIFLAYYALNLFGGARFDFADVYLPGVRHTVPHRPDWWPDWAKFEGGSDEPASEKTTDDETLTPAKLEN